MMLELMNGFLAGKNGRRVSIIVALLLLVGALTTLVHWHQDSPGQRCEICFARQLPGIHVPFAVSLAAPTLVEWWSRIEKPASIQSASCESQTSRAPPSSSSLT
jgi:hypothetical protein